MFRYFTGQSSHVREPELPTTAVGRAQVPASTPRGTARGPAPGYIAGDTQHGRPAGRVSVERLAAAQAMAAPRRSHRAPRERLPARQAPPERRSPPKTPRLPLAGAASLVIVALCLAAQQRSTPVTHRSADRAGVTAQDSAVLSPSPPAAPAGEDTGSAAADPASSPASSGEPREPEQPSRHEKAGAASAPPATAGRCGRFAAGTVSLPGPGQAASTIHVTGCAGNASTATRIVVLIDHPNRAALTVDLVGPARAVYRLRPVAQGNSSAGIAGTTTFNASTQPATGAWTLRITSSGAAGRLVTWSLTP